MLAPLPPDIPLTGYARVDENEGMTETFRCRSGCEETFPTSLHRTRHEVDSHTEPDPVLPFPCFYGCGKTFATERAESHHHRVCARNTQDFFNAD